MSFDYSKNNGNYIIGNANNTFITQWSTAGMGIIHCYRDKVKRLGYNPIFSEFPAIENIVKFDFSTRARSVQEGQVVILENRNNRFAAIKVLKVFRNNVDAGHLLEFEY